VFAPSILSGTIAPVILVEESIIDDDESYDSYHNLTFLNPGAFARINSRQSFRIHSMIPDGFIARFHGGRNRRSL